MNGMSEHKRNILVRECLEANAHYNMQRNPMASVIAEAYLMRVETITEGE